MAERDLTEPALERLRAIGYNAWHDISDRPCDIVVLLSIAEAHQLADLVARDASAAALYRHET